MKRSATKFVFSILLVVLKLNSYSQSAPFKCNEEQYTDEHSTADLKFNQLIDNACQEINKANYDNAYKMLSEAVYIDSVAHVPPDSYPTEFIKRQREKLKDYINNQRVAIAEINNSVVSNNAQPSKDNSTSKDLITDDTKSAKSEDVSKVRENDKKRKELIEEQKEIKPAVEPMRKAPAEVEMVVTPNEKKDFHQPIESEAKNGKEPESKISNAPEFEKDKVITGENVKAPIVNNSSFDKDKKVEVAPLSDQTNVEVVSSSKSFSETELDEFHIKGIQKVKELEDYIKLIIDRKTTQSIADEATGSALKLFDKEDRFVQVSSINSQHKSTFKVNKYLSKLRLLPYDNVEITWAEFQYASDFKKGDDGKFYGYITFRQKFSGIIKDQPAYEDITTKRIEVILQSYQKAIEGVETENWDVFLGDISVQQTEKK